MRVAYNERPTSVGKSRKQQLLPRAFGKYTLVEKIGEGGMAEVFRAVIRGPAQFEKTVALKRILPQFSNHPEFCQRFINEALLAAELNHINVTQVFDFGDAEDLHYIAMEYVEGMDASRLVQYLESRGQLLPEEAAIFVVAEAANGLAYAHAKTHNGVPLQIVHRDVSPQNILISYAGEVKIVDFGVAKIAAPFIGQRQQTQNGLLFGKLRYMSPEQVEGAALDERSDIFALGLVLYELLTQKPAIKATTPTAYIHELLAGQLAPPSKINPLISADLDSIVMTALATDRSIRYQHASDLAKDLTSLLNQRHMEFCRSDLGLLLDEAVPRSIGERCNSKKSRRMPKVMGEESRTIDPPAQLRSELLSSSFELPPLVPEATKDRPLCAKNFVSRSVSEASAQSNRPQIDLSAVVRRVWGTYRGGVLPRLKYSGTLITAAIVFLFGNTQFHRNSTAGGILAASREAAPSLFAAQPDSVFTHHLSADPTVKTLVQSQIGHEDLIFQPDIVNSGRRILRLDGKVVVGGKVESWRDLSSGDQDAARKAAALCRSGDEKLGSKQYESAESLYQAALSAYPGYVVAYRGLGRAYAAQGQIDLALSSLHVYLKMGLSESDRPLVRGWVKKLGREMGPTILNGGE